MEELVVAVVAALRKSTPEEQRVALVVQGL
jgi:hypothetical protein